LADYFFVLLTGTDVNMRHKPEKSMRGWCVWSTRASLVCKVVSGWIPSGHTWEPRLMGLSWTGIC